MNTKPSGRFGEFVKQYEKARRPYPAKVFKFLKSLIKTERPLILDLGCGTGISTRQLAKFSDVVGVDPDPKMLKAAKAYRAPRIKRYVLAKANKLPFKDNTFDAVTAFSAFHWFTDKNSVGKIKRILKPGGIFFVSGNVGVRNWGMGHRSTIVKAIGREIAQFVSPMYKPFEIFRKNGFKDIKRKHWRKSEFFSIGRVMQYVQSVSIWNSVPKHLRSIALDALEKYYNNMLKRRGKIERRLKVYAIAGKK